MREFLKLKFMGKNAAEEAPNSKAFTAHFNKIAGVVSSSILDFNYTDERGQMIEFWLKVCEHCRLLQNFESVLAIVAGLTTTPINRLKLSWYYVPVTAVGFFEDCRGLMDKNFAKLRAEVEMAVPPVIPYIGMFQRDLVYLEESPTMKGEVVNLSKMKSITAAIQNCLKHQQSVYWFKEVPEIQNLINNTHVLSEEEAHARSLALESRKQVEMFESAGEEGTGAVGAKHGVAGEKMATNGEAPRKSLASKLREMKDQELPKLSLFAPPLSERDEYKQYMLLKYEYVRRGLATDGGYNNLEPLRDGEHLNIKSGVEELVHPPIISLEQRKVQEAEQRLERAKSELEKAKVKERGQSIEAELVTSQEKGLTAPKRSSVLARGSRSPRTSAAYSPLTSPTGSPRASPRGSPRQSLNLGKITMSGLSPRDCASEPLEKLSPRIGSRRASKKQEPQNDK